MAASPLTLKSEMEASRPVLPVHLAVIMDGNGRWAKARGESVVYGHRAGAEAAQRCVQAAVKAGIPYLTLYTFSSENWGRPRDEVAHLETLLRYYLREKLPELEREKIHFNVIGEPGRFGDDLSRELQEAMTRTASHTRLTLSLALSYGSRQELLECARQLAVDVQAGRRTPEALTEEDFREKLQTSGLPDPDLVLRTGGDHRISNFLLWQSAYAEFVFLDTLWPDFGEREFDGVLECFAKRQRRFGQRPGGDKGS